MALEPVLSFVDTAAFRRIGDIDCAIWTYSLSWSAAETWWSLASRETATGFAHVAIKFSHRLDIHPPTEFPEVPEIRATSLEKPAAGAAQKPRQDVRCRTSASHPISLCRARNKG